MPSIGPAFWILGWLVASVSTDQTTTPAELSPSPSTARGFNNPNLSTDDALSTLPPRTSITTNSNSTTMMTSSANNSTSEAMVTNTSVSLTTQAGRGAPAPSASGSTKATQRTTTRRKEITEKITTVAKPLSEAGDRTGIIILIVIIIVALAFAVGCFFARKRGRRYSVDFASRQDETNIPLSAVEPEMPPETVPQNGLQTFVSPDTAAEEPQQPEKPSEVEEEPTAEADKSAVEPSAEPAAPAPSPESSEDEPKEDVAEQSPPAPVEPSVEEKTDDEGVNSNQTSVESLKEANENNSNNADVSQERDFKPSCLFWDVPLDCPV
ncbi:uncharacterized protein V6R79_016199 [Siganus canaliculatus]